MMRRLMLSAVVLGLLGSAALVRAEEAAKEITVTGSLVCSECQLGIGENHQDALVIKDGEKKVVYLLSATPNHANVCHQAIDGVTVTGALSMKNNQNYLAVTKFELPKK